MKPGYKTTEFWTTVTLLIAIGLFAGPWQATAQSILPWRSQVEQRLRDQNQLIGQLIAGQRQQGPQAPAPILINPQPYQLLPIPGDPKQQLPIQGEPKQQLPVPGEPKQVLPPGGQPKQDLPLQGAPRQLVPPSTEPPQAYTIRYHALARPWNDPSEPRPSGSGMDPRAR